MNAKPAKPASNLSLLMSRAGIVPLVTFSDGDVSEVLRKC